MPYEIPPKFVMPSDDPRIDPMDAVQRLTDAFAQVEDKQHADVRLVGAHAAIAVAVLLDEIQEVSDENDRLITKNRKLQGRVDRLEKAAKRTGRALAEASAATRELRTNLNAERRLRQRTGPVEDAAVSAGNSPLTGGPGEEMVQLRTELQRAHIDIDGLIGEVEAAERKRDAAVQRAALLAHRLEVLGAEGQDEPEAPRTPATFAEVLADGEHPLLFMSLDRSVTADLDRHAAAPGWRRCVVDTIATMTAYATAKAEARRAGRAAGADLADLRAFTRSGHEQVRISPRRISRSESATVTGTARLAQQRRFPVPRSVSPDGFATVLAHIRIGAPPPSPRMYFLDRTDVADDGRIYLVYLGPHLDNTLTN